MESLQGIIDLVGSMAGNFGFKADIGEIISGTVDENGYGVNVDLGKLLGMEGGLSIQIVREKVAGSQTYVLKSVNIDLNLQMKFFGTNLVIASGNITMTNNNPGQAVDFSAFHAAVSDAAKTFGCPDFAALAQKVADNGGVLKTPNPRPNPNLRHKRGGNRNMDRGVTYIVTGCTGYVGNVLTKKLLAENCRVVGFARSHQKAEQVFKEQKPAFVFGDIANRADVERLFEGEGPFVVIHTVAKVTIGEGSKKELYDVTVKGTRNVTDACCAHGAIKLLHISSTERCRSGLRLKEDLSNYIPCPKRARKGYARAKSEADAIVLNAVKERGLNASLLLLAGVLGPGDYSNSHMSQMFIDYIEGRLPPRSAAVTMISISATWRKCSPPSWKERRKAKVIFSPTSRIPSTTASPSFPK